MSYPERIGAFAFSGCSSLKELNLSEGVVSIGEFAFSDGGFVELVIPDSVTSMGMWAFASCYYLERLTIGSGLKNIPEGAFIYCGSYLETVVISEGVETIGKQAFANCYSIKQVSLPDSISSIGDEAFYRCSDMHTIIVGSGLAEVGNSAFAECTGIKTVYYRGTPENWDAISFNGNNPEFMYAYRRYYFSETKPDGEGRFWHYSEDGKPVKW